jgi:hypothetical protein
MKMRTNKFGFLILILALIFQTNLSYSKEQSILEIGLFGGVKSNSHKAGFVEMPGFPNCCTPYNNASSSGIEAGLALEYYLSNNFSVQLRTGMMTIGAELTSTEYIGNKEVAGEKANAYTNHSLNSKITLGYAAPVFVFKPISSIPIRLQLGFLGSIFLQRSFVQQETLNTDLSSNGVQFTNGTNAQGTSRNYSEGKIPYSSFYFSVFSSIGYEIDLSSIKIKPEINYNLNINEISTYTGWKIDNLGFSVMFSYPLVKEDVIEEKIIVEPKKVEPEIVLKKETPIVQEIVIRDTIQTNKQPIVKESKQEEIPKNEASLIQGVELLKDFANWKCCYIILYSSPNKKTSEKILKEAKISNIKDLSIINWYDKDDKVTYYRVRTKCISSQEEVLLYKDQVLNYLSHTKNTITPVIKCE